MHLYSNFYSCMFIDGARNFHSVGGGGYSQRGVPVGSTTNPGLPQSPVYIFWLQKRSKFEKFAQFTSWFL